MEITFTHTGGSTDWVYVLRDNGTPLRWPWPSYGTELPADLVHYLVETRLGMRHGFWGMVADGTSFGYLSNAADRIRAGLPLKPLDTPEPDLTELVQVECVVEAVRTGGGVGGAVAPAGPAGSPGPAVPDASCLRTLRRACAGRGVPVPAAFDPCATAAAEKAIGELRAELAELAARWQALAAGRSLVLSYNY